MKREEWNILMQEMAMWNERYREKNFYSKSKEKREKLKGLKYNIDEEPCWDSMETARNKAFAGQLQDMWNGVLSDMELTRIKFKQLEEANLGD